MRAYTYPVFGTQGGGLVREVNGTFIFVEKPNCPGLDVGDEMPAEWDCQPANDLAQAQVRDGAEVAPPWDQDPDGVRAYLNMPDHYHHMR